MTKMVWIVLVLAILIAGGLYIHRSTSTSHISPPVNHGPIVSRICHESPEGSQVDIYRDDSGNIGGFVVTIKGMRDGEGQIYDAQANLIWEGPVQLSEFESWVKTLMQSFPVVVNADCW
jgi:hypothetical protein